VKARVINNGQSCIAAKRFIVAETHRRRVRERKFVAKMKSAESGRSDGCGDELGPLATADAVKDLEADVKKR
jgi:succinate-semialdehyde dehydrogenase / glutarate-semialdehyde dehydrogenase